MSRRSIENRALYAVGTAGAAGGLFSFATGTMSEIINKKPELIQEFQTMQVAGIIGGIIGLASLYVADRRHAHDVLGVSSYGIRDFLGRGGNPPKNS